MNKLWNSIKWLAGTLALFGAFMLSDMLRGDPITLRHYIAAAGMAGFFGINSLPLKWAVQQRFAFNFCYVFLSIPAILFYFGDPFTWISYIFVPLGLALSMAAIFSIDDLRRAETEPGASQTSQCQSKGSLKSPNPWQQNIIQRNTHEHTACIHQTNSRRIGFVWRICRRRIMGWRIVYHVRLHRRRLAGRIYRAQRAAAQRLGAARLCLALWLHSPCHASRIALFRRPVHMVGLCFQIACQRIERRYPLHPC